MDEGAIVASSSCSFERHGDVEPIGRVEFVAAVPLFGEATGTPEPSVEEDPLLGAVLAGTYRIDRIVAEGGMGRLYGGVHERLAMPVAVKVLLELRGGRTEAIERAEREARAMASMTSPNVARVLDL